MILYQKTPIPFKMKNIMMLDVSVDNLEEGEAPIVYISKNTYDQCLRMQARLDGEIGYICRSVGVDYSIGTIVDWFYNNAPKPVNMLAPFIGVLQRAGSTIDIGDIEKCFGYLHVLSQICDFDGCTKVNADIRADLDVSKSVLNSYKESWDDLTQSLYDRVPTNLATSNVYMAGNAEQEESSTSDISPEDLFDENADISQDDFVAMMDALLAEAEAETAAEEAAVGKVEPEPVAVTTTVSSVPTTSDESAQEQQYKQENDQIASMFSKFVGK